MKRARGRMHCDFAFFVGGTHDNVADLAELERLPGAAGIKVFSFVTPLAPPLSYMGPGVAGFMVFLLALVSVMVAMVA